MDRLPTEYAVLELWASVGLINEIRYHFDAEYHARWYKLATLYATDDELIRRAEDAAALRQQITTYRRLA